MKRLSLYVPVLACAAASFAMACQVPVFRYALERWPADNYEIVVLHDRPLNESEQSAVQELRDSTLVSGQTVSVSGQTVSNPTANCQVRVINVAQSDDKRIQSLYAGNSVDDQPILAVFYPQNAQEVPDHLVGVHPLDIDSVAHLIDSPLRQTIANRLISGESAVWIFVPCGDPAQDDVAFKTLLREVESNKRSLQLPEQEPIEDEKALLEQVEIELRLDFSVVTLSRDDPKERHLLKMLLASESDLEDMSTPMAFPVLGRGRVLYALVGKGISSDTISMASRFMIGPCSCQVKNQNPGFDLLMNFDWDGKIGEAKLSDPLPEGNGKPVLLSIPSGKKK